jgi:DNA-directed RNA polymerase specialized sigma24 family protein
VHLEPLLEWYNNPERSPLDLLEEQETCALVQEALARLDAACAHLLRACYLEGVSIAALREQLGLETIQGVYYRRAKCLQKAFRHLNKRLLVCSPGAAEGTADGSPRGGDPRA